MPFTTPRTWTDTELIDSDIMNEHVRDQLLAGFPTEAVYESWTPTRSNITLGNGTETARYIRIGDMVHVWYLLVFGSTTAITGSYPSISLPVNAHASLTGAGPAVGTAVARDDGSATLYGGPLYIETPGATTLAYPQFWNIAAGSYARVTAPNTTVPFTWAVGDYLAFDGRYEAAA